MKKFLFVLLMMCGSVWASPITLIVPYAAGGPMDIMARAVQKTLEAETQRPVVIEYRLGAGGDLATAHLANSKDTVFMIHSVGMIVNQLIKTPNYNVQNINHVVTLGHSPMVLVASQRLGIKNFAEFSMSNRSFTYGSSGIGSGTHLAGEILTADTQKNLIHVPYKGSAANIPDLVSGNLDLAFMYFNLAEPYIGGGQLVPLAVGAKTRLPEMPNVPTMRELRYNDTGYRNWFALFSNRDSSDPTVQTVISAFQRMWKVANIRQIYQSVGLEVEAVPEVLIKDFVVKEQQFYTKVLKKIDIK